MMPATPARPGEFEIIERYFTRASRDTAVEVGIGDDAAIVVASGRLAIAVDTLVAGTHFPPSATPESIGHRALAVNLSDLAAVGAVPRWATLALCLAESDPVWLDGFARGFFALADRYSVSLIGGDTTRGPLAMTVTVLGDVPGRALLRSAGTSGDRIFVSGTVGDAAAGLAILQSDPTSTAADSRALVERFCHPEPRVALGRALTGLANACIDVSDGLIVDLGHICEQSACGAVIDLDALPLSAALRSTRTAADAEALALGGGDDYELCFTVPPARVESVVAAARAVGTPVTAIGELTAAPGIRGRRQGRIAALEAGGFRHF
jgi:thiamine-monophosphate kinase